MKLFNKVAIVGTGLIGGSIALALKKQKLCNQVIGVSRHKETIAYALKHGIIDSGSQDLKIIAGADMVILATSVGLILDLSKQVAKLVGKDCLLCDVGSTKEQIVSRLEKIFPNFIGCHPLAGSEKRGIANSKAELFKNSCCILTPTKNTSKQAREKLDRMWKALGAKVVFMPAGKHDEILSFTSHLPHALAFSLISSVPKSSLDFSAGGLKDTTRIAASDPQLWADIFLSNKKNILKAMEVFQLNLNALKSAVKKNDKAALNKFLRLAQIKRESLNS